MDRDVNSYKFVSGITKRVVKSWISLEPYRDIPWTAFKKPISECRVALVSSGGIALKTDPPFDQAGERQNPWWGDTSFRVLPRDATEKDVAVYHLHINRSYVEEDINCLLPLQRLVALERRGEIGYAADHHYTFMGYTPQPDKLIRKSVPAIINHLEMEGVDVVILIPA